MQDAERPTRVALIGCGGISGNHLAGYRHVPEAELVACCDVSQERAEEFAHRAGISDTYTDCADVMARDDIEMIDICAIDEVHAEIAIAALQSGKHALIEKPFAMTVEEGEAVLSTNREALRKPLRTYPHYYNRPVQSYLD